MNNYRIFLVGKDGTRTEQRGEFHYMEDVSAFIADKGRFLFSGEKIEIEPTAEKKEEAK